MPYLEGMARMDTRLFVAMHGEAGRHSADHLLPQIRVPTLAVCGAEDRLTPVKYHRFLEAQIPGCRLTIIEQAGHWVFWEQPDAFTRAVRAFLDELPRPTSEA